MKHWTGSPTLLAMLSAIGLAACGGGGGDAPSTPDTPPVSTAKYDVTVTRTQYGVPHINGRDFGSLGYGYGYAFAEDNLCTMMDDYVAIRGERAKYFGRAGSYSIPAVPVTASNVDSDFFWRLTADSAAIARFKAGAVAEVQQASLGYVDGFNRYIRELKGGQHPGRHAACATAPWLNEITEDDMYRRYIRLAVIASSSALTTEIATAQPPIIALPSAVAGATAAAAAGKSADAAARGALAQLSPDAQPFARLRTKRFGSNMYALGKNATDSGQPIVFGNPHFPWTGTERLYLAHLTVPGQMDIMGVGLYGVPLALIGFNDHFAWSHTVSTAFRFTLYELAINPLNPKQYYYEGQLKDLTAVPMTIDVTEADGSHSQESRTLYRSQYGPMLEISASGVQVLGWTATTAFTLRDANLENDRLINQFFRWNTAQSFDEFKALHKSVLGTPWVNTVASGPDGRAYYGDVTVVPNVPDALVKDCTPPLTGVLVGALVPGLPVLQGNRADCQWLNDADAPAPGIFGPSHLPTLERDDFVSNFNDSYWLTNPAQPITGYARVIGDEGSERSLRTRLGILQMQRRLDGSDGRSGNTFNLQTLQDTVLSSHIYSGELARDAALASFCTSATTAACTSLQGWDLSDNLDSRGGHVWREFWRGALGARSLWKTAFDVNDPVNTPRDLNTGSPAVRKAFTDGIAAVGAAGFAVDAPFGTIQKSGVNTAADGSSIPLFGGEQFEGGFTIAISGPLSMQGYPVDYGNSYIQTVTWDSGGVVAEGFVTYSESTDPANPHYADFTQAYSGKQWYRFPFHAADVAAAKQSEQRLTE